MDRSQIQEGFQYKSFSTTWFQLWYPKESMNTEGVKLQEYAHNLPIEIPNACLERKTTKFKYR